MTHEEKIKDIIDFHLTRQAELGINMLPGDIDPEMAAPTQDYDDEWKAWQSIESQVTDNDIQLIEDKIGFRLPNEYKAFLKHKHFYELQISEVSFCKHPIRIWKDKLIEMNFDGYPTEYLIEKGYITFADYSDWGLLCFDTNTNSSEYNYPIILWDHEIPDDVQMKYRSFYDLMIAIDLEEKKNGIGND